MNFQSWLTQKKVKESDLVFTKALRNADDQHHFENIAEKMAQLNPTFTEGVQFLEYATDLLLMGHTLEHLLEHSESFESWAKNLYRLRFPQTVNRDQDLKETLEKLPWPTGSKVKFERRGDKAGVELKVFISSKNDLIRTMASLERVQQEMKS